MPVPCGSEPTLVQTITQLSSVEGCSPHMGIVIGDICVPQISDNLRQMLLNADSDNADLFTEAEKDQSLFRIFRHLCLGGGMYQFEV